MVLDVRMPGLDGWQTLERLRDLSEAPVLMHTGTTPSAESSPACAPTSTASSTSPPRGRSSPTRVGRAPSRGTLRRSSSSHTVARASLGARQSPRGESEPPEPTFGPFGIAERLNWLIWKKRKRKTLEPVLDRRRSVVLVAALGAGSGPARRRAARRPSACCGQERDLARPEAEAQDVVQEEVLQLVRADLALACSGGRLVAVAPGPAPARSRCQDRLQDRVDLVVELAACRSPSG